MKHDRQRKRRLAAIRQDAFVKAQSRMGRRIGSIVLWFFRRIVHPSRFEDTKRDRFVSQIMVFAVYATFCLGVGLVAAAVIANRVGNPYLETIFSSLAAITAGIFFFIGTLLNVLFWGEGLFKSGTQVQEISKTNHPVKYWTGILLLLGCSTLLIVIGLFFFARRLLAEP